MQILSWRLTPYQLAFKHPWRFHRETLTQRFGWILELTTTTGKHGLGDCAPLVAAGTESVTEAKRWLAHELPRLLQQPLEVALASLPTVTTAPAARHAVETALLDLASQTKELSLRHWLSSDAKDEIEVNGSAGALDQWTHQRTQPLLKQGFKLIKLKVGLAKITEELELLRRLAAELPAGIRLRLDANGAWTREQASEFLDDAADLPIESLEEPLIEPRADWLSALQAETPITLALDESLTRFHLAELFERPPVRRLILKPTVLGGLLSTKQIADDADSAGLESLITSTLESTVGVHAAAQLAAALSPAIHGLATSEWFGQDVAPNPIIQQGRLQLPNTAGLGVQLYSNLDQTEKSG